MARKGERQRYIEERLVDGHRLGRLLHHDPRSRQFGVAPLLEKRKRPASTTWWRRGVTDQGNTSSCVGHAVAGLVGTSPHRQHVSRDALGGLDPYVLYRWAQDLDPWPAGEPDYYGTSTLAGLAAAKRAGLIDEYRWCFGLDDVLATLSHYGPVVVGVNWYEGFDRPGEDGRLRIAGEVRGGHAVQLLGVNPDDKTVRGVNSWGPGWADRGRFEWEWATLERLLGEEGEAGCAVVHEGRPDALGAEDPESEPEAEPEGPQEPE